MTSTWTSKTRRSAGTIYSEGEIMLYELMPYLWYAAGSICFLVGSGIVIYRIIAGA